MENKTHWNPDTYARHASFNVELAGQVLELLDPRPGEHILDLGCGEGSLTRQLVDRGCQVVGVDSSAAQVDSARAHGLDARVADGEDLAFEGEFDAVFSNAALHWMRRPERVIRGVRRALKPRGRFVGELGGHGCVAAIRVALHAVLGRYGVSGAAMEPWFFPDASTYAHHLEAGGFEVVHIELTARPTRLPTGLEGWLDTFAGEMLSAIPDSKRGRARDEVIALVAPVLRDQDGCWTADYMRLRFLARLRPTS